jgi:hypothetical protein
MKDSLIRGTPCLWESRALRPAIDIVLQVRRHQDRALVLGLDDDLAGGGLGFLFRLDGGLRHIIVLTVWVMPGHPMMVSMQSRRATCSIPAALIQALGARKKIAFSAVRDGH